MPATCAPSTRARTRSGCCSSTAPGLDDPYRILEGEGTQTRFIRVRESADQLAATIAGYVRDAIVERLFRR